MTSKSVGVARRRHRQKELEDGERILRKREVELRLREMETKIHATDAILGRFCLKNKNV